MCLHSRDSWAERWLRALALLGVDCDLTMTLASAPQLLGTQTLCHGGKAELYCSLPRNFSESQGFLSVASLG